LKAALVIAILVLKYLKNQHFIDEAKAKAKQVKYDLKQPTLLQNC
jgi:hypothetical protein